MSETTVKVAELTKSLALSASCFAQDAAFAIPFSHVFLPQGIALDAVLKPEFWAHVANKLVQNQRILVDAQDGTFSAQLKVHSCSRLEAVVSVEWKADAVEAAAADAVRPEDAYRIHWAGPTAKFRISRNSDNATISDGHATKVIAHNELRGYLQALAA